MVREATPREKKINRNSTLIVLAGIALISALSYWVLSISVGPQTVQQAGSENERQHPLTLMAFQRKTDGLMAPLDHLLLAGETVIFKIATVKPLVVALVLSVDEQPPVTTYQDARIPPGPARLVAKYDGPYQYTANATDHSLRMCVLGGADQTELNRQLRQLPSLWRQLPASSCVQLR